MFIKLSGYNLPEQLIQSGAAFSGPEPTLMGLAVGVPGLVAATWPSGCEISR